MRISRILTSTRAKGAKTVPNLRGVRQMLYWDSETRTTGRARPDFCNSPDFRRGFALLEKHDLHFELQVYAGQAAYAVELIKAFPNVRMILVHAGMLTARTQAAIDQWRAALTMMAAFPNLHVKISGLGMYSSGDDAAAGAAGDPRRHPDLSAWNARSMAAIFRWKNCTRAMPTSSASTGPYYRSITEAEQRAVLHDNAVRIGLRWHAREGGASSNR